jgi:hypothetical protein
MLAFDPCSIVGDQDGDNVASGRSVGLSAFVRGAKGISSACRSRALQKLSRGASVTSFRGRALATHVVAQMQLIAQEDGEIMVPSPHHAKLQKSCLTTSLSVAAALYFGQFDCATLSLLVLLASVVYWKNPRKGLRRNVDMTLAFGGLLYQAIARVRASAYSGGPCLHRQYVARAQPPALAQRHSSAALSCRVRARGSRRRLSRRGSRGAAAHQCLTGADGCADAGACA